MFAVKQSKKRQRRQKELNDEVVHTAIQELKTCVQKFKSETSPRQTNNDGILKVFSDCAGISSEMIALFLLGWPSSMVEFVGGCENDPVKRCLLQSVHRTLSLNTKKGKLDRDLFDRSLRTCEPSDIYIAGFPCPAYSSLGRKRGARDPQGRGLHIFKGMQYVARFKPRVVMLENVKGFLQKKHRKTHAVLRKAFEALGYKSYMKVLNTNEHGVPQSRQRVYVIAFLQNKKKETSFRFPKPVNCPKLQHFLKPQMGSEKMRLPNYEAKYGTEFWKQDVVLDIGCSKKFQSMMHGSVPCLTRGRCLQQGYYVPRKLRRLSGAECARLQSVPQGLYEEMKAFLRKKWNATMRPMRQKNK